MFQEFLSRGVTLRRTGAQFDLCKAKRTIRRARIGLKAPDADLIGERTSGAWISMAASPIQEMR
jgi:hypothetical protein